MLKGGKQHQLESALAQASTYQEWLSVAQELDAEDGHKGLRRHCAQCCSK